MASNQSAGWVVHKFGGTSLADADCFRQVARVLAVDREASRGRQAIVVSAMAGVTDGLIEWIDLAGRNDPRQKDTRTTLWARHERAARELLGERGAQTYLKKIEAGFDEVAHFGQVASTMRHAPELIREIVSGYGELWSAQLLATYLRASNVDAGWINAREILVVEDFETGPGPVWAESQSRLDGYLADHAAQTLVITGYVASYENGTPTTLKRNGSDYSASIFSVLLAAQSLTIWTDVDGIMSADPRRVSDHVVLEDLSYDEAIELAYFGAKVLHPKTMGPALAQNIPIRVRNTFNPDAPGTSIVPNAEVREGSATLVRGFSTIDDLALVTLAGTGMIGVPGIAQRVFAAVGRAGVSVRLISQGSSEHSICFVVDGGDGETVRSVVQAEFASEIAAGRIQGTEVRSGMSILAAVGDNLVRTRGIAARFFGAMARAGVNINAIAQGSSERNISAVIDTSDSTRALRAVHTDFHLSDEVISLGLIGPGLIGKTLLRQLEAQAPRLKEVQQLDFQVRGICGSREMLCGDRGLVSSDWEAEQDRRPVDMEEFVRHIRAGDSPHTILVDCTASDDVAGRYSEWLERRCHIVTPNKKANSSSKELYSALRQLADRQNVHFLYEATVGAGLPVIATLRELLNTGDEVLRIEGVLSGTLSYIFNSLSPGESFAGVVQRARDLGYTEPDPRDDLSGMDVARKLIILARECGCEIELDDVDVETMVPEALRETSVDGFLERLGEFDTDLGRRCEAAAAEGRCLRYVGVHDATTGRCSAGLEAYPNSHPFARLDSSCNLIGFTTNRYREMPLYVQGPGAGPDVTAAGVFGDLLRLAARLRRPLPHTLADRDD